MKWNCPNNTSSCCVPERACRDQTEEENAEWMKRSRYLRWRPSLLIGNHWLFSFLFFFFVNEIVATLSDKHGFKPALLPRWASTCGCLKCFGLVQFFCAYLVSEIHRGSQGGNDSERALCGNRVEQCLQWTGGQWWHHLCFCPEIKDNIFVGPREVYFWIRKLNCRLKVEFGTVRLSKCASLISFYIFV